MRATRFRWDGSDPGEAERVRALAPPGEEVASRVADTIAAVREGGDAALLELGERYDGVRPAALRVGEGELRDAPSSLDDDLLGALTLAAANVRTVAEAQLVADPPPIEFPQGQRVALREVPVAAAAVYVPGGRAAYPSSAIMGCVAASAAGVARVAIASPPGPDGRIVPAVLAAAAIAGATEAYAIGGAQAIAALAFGTETVAPVDVIAGPGGPYVQEAKLQVSRRVGIDGYAGPSELMVLFDAEAPLEWLALDLCAQAEHGADGLLVAASPQRSLLDELAGVVEARAAERPSVNDAALALVELSDLEAGIALADRIAPEHLQIACAGAERLAAEVRTAGCVFAGAASATAFGDYVAGSNHVLPTAGAGRFAGPLGPRAFRRPLSVVEIDAGAAAALAPPLKTLAEAEGFPVHAESAAVRAGAPRGANAAGGGEGR
jgi:histidinol dehydrogenase